MASGCTLLQEIRQVETSISECYEKVYLLKSKLGSGKLSQDQKDKLREELSEVEKLLATNKSILKTLHKGNRTTFLAASAICLLIFILWMLYNLAFSQTY